MDLTPKQQTSEAIRQAETILITTGQHPSVDQVSAVIGLAMILRKFGKKVTAVISDSLPQSVQLLDTSMLDRNMSGLRDFVLKLDVSKAEVDKLRYEVVDGKLQIFVTPYKGGFAPSDVTFDYGESHYQYDLAVVLGVPTRARIDRIYEQNPSMFATLPVVNLDFHRSNENYGAVNLIEPNASSLCEMLVAMAESLQGGIIDAEIATALVMGIIASTDRFTAAHTTSKSLTVAAQMMAAGARQQAVVRALYREGKGEQNRGGERDRGGNGGDRGSDRNNERGDRGPREGREQNRDSNREVPRESVREGARDHQRPAAPAASNSGPSSAAPVTAPAAVPLASASSAPAAASGAESPSVVPQPAPAAAAPSTVSAPVASAAPIPSTNQPTAEAQPELVHAPASSAPFTPVLTGGESDLPIIQPSHIELSQPMAAADSPAAPAPAPVSMADYSAASVRLNQTAPVAGQPASSAPARSVSPAPAVSAPAQPAPAPSAAPQPTGAEPSA